MSTLREQVAQISSEARETMDKTTHSDQPFLQMRVTELCDYIERLCDILSIVVQKEGGEDQY